ncbi:two-component system OmpR family response regulator [Altererythrobacter atlanticus]|uniref:Transcriptional regulatory protein BasR n=1 Tax=Croceibacterium atlanticum TaxID=1267766 RepID=A0A0F7KUF9_9SPHN|nr:response regulator transcription factor [Croceibacterium atlanticum]AKH42877.1 Transcriptional regulatory protein BasR [Croceibacterium atlanticum]MBB5731657.1 two-component system OmpR family response regulator [Croceibacterium atlanticum]
MRVLLVEDDPELGRRLGDRLRGADYAVDLATSAEEARNWPDLEKMAAIILDLGLPDDDGIVLLKQWRAAGLPCPILILTARGTWQDKVEGLNAGADDFMVKPVRFEELQARLNAISRRHANNRTSTLEAGSLRLDPVGRTVEDNGAPLALSRREFSLLHLFMRRAGQILSQGDILEDLYDLEAERELNTVEVLVGRLRRKIGRDRIRTVRGMGYRFDK